MISKRLLQVKPSPTMALARRARLLKSQGKDVISLAVGEPSWPTPASICQAAAQAMAQGQTKYTPADGSPVLKKSISAYTTRLLGFEVLDSQVTVSIGAKFVLFSALQSLCDPTDEVLAAAPFWVSYPSMAMLAGARFVPIPTTADTHFKLQPEHLQNALTPQTKILILNSPNNPTGSVLSLPELKALGEVIKKHPKITVLSDDIYNQLCFSRPAAPHILQACPELKDRVLCINSVSKNYSMTGWRVGWAVGKEEIIQAMSRFQSQSVSCACSIAQAASAYALDHGEAEVAKARQTLIQTRPRMLAEFSAIPGFKVFPPEGAFYMWINVSKFFGRAYKGKPIKTSADFAECLFQAELVLCVPGEAFGLGGYVRIHFALDAAAMNKALKRIQHFAAGLN